MSHPRTAIRDALVDRLKTKVDDVFLTDAGDKIYGAARLTYGITYYTSNKEPENSGTIPTEIEANFS